MVVRMMLNKKQLTLITANAITVKMLMTYPRAFVLIGGNAAWITSLYCTVAAVLVFALIRYFYGINKNVIEIANDCGGTWLRIATGSVVFVLMALNLISLIRIFPEIIKLVLLQKTYVELIGLMFLAVLVLGARCGIESIGRVHAIFIPIAGVIFLIFILLLIPEFNTDAASPVLGKGVFSVFGEGISGLSLFSDLLLLNLLLPHSENLDAYKKSGTKGIMIGGICATIIMGAYCLSYVYPVSEIFYVPVYQLERLIHLSSFFSRFEAIFQFIWTISIMLYGALYFAVLADVWKLTFRLSDTAPLLCPIAVLVVGAAMLSKSMSDMVDVEFYVMKWIYIPALFIPLIFGIASKYKYK